MQSHVKLSIVSPYSGVKVLCHFPFWYKIQCCFASLINKAIVPCERPSPTQQANNFGSKILLGLRNPLTAFPAYHQSKAEAYHAQVGQVDKKAWEDFRDQWVGTGGKSTLFDEWKKFIMTWRWVLVHVSFTRRLPFGFLTICLLLWQRYGTI